MSTYIKYISIFFICFDKTLLIVADVLLGFVKIMIQVLTKV